MTASSHGSRSTVALPITIASPSPVDDLRLGEALLVGAQVEEAERIRRAEVRRPPR